MESSYVLLIVGLLFCNIVVVVVVASSEREDQLQQHQVKEDEEHSVERGRLLEYCHFETFNASCPRGSVVLMLRALYGRMSLGRCTKSDVSIGCHSDVLREFDSRCSGQPSCTVAIPDASLHDTLNCPNDMMPFLQASYKCLEVTQGDEVNECNSRQPVRIQAPSIGFGYLSSYWMRFLGWSSCPLVISAPAGQKIEMFILNFSSLPRYRSDHDRDDDGTNEKFLPRHALQDQRQPAEDQRGFPGINNMLEYCHVYAVLSEQDKKKDITVCYGSARETHVYSSNTNALTLKFSDQVASDRSLSFLIKYGVRGCPDLTPPKNAWIRRTNDQARITCNSTGLKWHLVCRGTSWVGQHAVSNCDDKSAQEEGLFQGPSFPTYGLLTAVVTGVFIGAVCGFSLLGGVLWCKRRTTRSRNHKECSLQMIQDGMRIQGPPTETTEYDESATYDPHYHHHHHHHHHGFYLGQSRFAQQTPEHFHSGGSFQPPCKVHHRLENGEYGYTHVWEIAGSDGETKQPRHPLTDAEEQTPDHKFSAYSPISHNGSRLNNALLPAPTTSQSNLAGKQSVSSFKPQQQDSVYTKDSSKVCAYQSCSNQRPANYSFVQLSEATAGLKAQPNDGSRPTQHHKTTLEHPSLLQDHVQKLSADNRGVQSVVAGDTVDVDWSSGKSKDFYRSQECCTSAPPTSGVGALTNQKKMENHYT